MREETGAEPGRAGMSGPPKVLIVEDHELLAQSLTFALQADGIDVARCPELGAEAVLASADRFAPDLVLLDLDLGEEGSSLPLIEPLRAQGAEVVMLTGVTDRQRLAECVEAGAIGIVSKREPFENLVRAVHDCMALGALLTPQQRDALLRELREQRAAAADRRRWFDTLTRREQEVLAALMDGRSAEEIAEAWVVSVSTVRSQIRAVLMKLGVHSQLAAVARAREADWELPPE
jgi:DNA-binding NarL/FixJ family response regulator